MILPDFVLSTRIGPPILNYGLDHCPEKNKEHYLNFPYKVEYKFNDRGYRDIEWPNLLNDLQDAIWCVGDSFTVGLGSPFEHTWPQILQTRTSRRTINVSMDGASNEWILRKIKRIVEVIEPKNIVALWSYFHRREDIDVNKIDEDRRIYGGRSSDSQDYDNFMYCMNSTNKYKKITQIQHFTIPDAQSCYEINLAWNAFRGSDWPNTAPRNSQDFFQLPDFIKLEIIETFDIDKQFQLLLLRNDQFDEYKKLENIIEVPQLDFARDAHHFDIKTSTWLVDQILL